MNCAWQRKKLSEFASVSTGPFGSLLHKSDYVDRGVPLVNPTNIIGDRIVPDPRKLIDAQTQRRLSSYVLEEGDIVVGRRGEIGRCAVVGPDEVGWLCGTGSFFIRPSSSIDPRFLAHLIRFDGYRDELERAATGTTMKNLSNVALGDLVVAVPSLAEQQRIVGILDEAFEGIATAKANAEKNLQNARALFESQLQAAFARLGPGCKERLLGEVVERLTNGFVGPTRDIYVESGVPYLLARHVKSNRLNFDGKTFVSDAFNRKNKKSMLKTGDVLLVQSGHIGHSALVSKEHEGHNCHAMIVITPIAEILTGQFLSLQFNSPVMQRQFARIRSGSTVPHLTCGAVRELPIVIPDLMTQRRLVDHTQDMGAETDRLANLYEQKLAALDALKKSLLHQAFSGRL